MNPTSKKFISLFLVFSLMMLSVHLYAKERRGAKLIITKLDGQLIKGELIVVKPNSLLLLDTEGKDVSVGIEDIKVIIVKKSQVVEGAFAGLVGGALNIALFGLIFKANVGETLSVIVRRGWPWLAVGAIIGAILGALIKKSKKIKIEGMTDSEIQETLDKLRKKARIRDYR